MMRQNPGYEQLVIETLRRHRTMTMEGLVAAVPTLTWNCVFQAVDELSRGGRIAVYRRGFDYELSLPADAQLASSAA